MPELRLEEVLRQKDRLPRRQKLLCEYIIQNTYEAAALTARQLAEKAGVGEATVFRFLKGAGYPAYSEFRAELHQYSIEFTQSSYWQMRASLQDKNRQDGKHVLCRTVSETVELLEESVTPKLMSKFDRAVEVLLAAPAVGILGLRSSKAVALYFYSLLLPFLKTVRQFSYDEHFVFEQIRNMPEGSTMVAVSSWPNTKTAIRAAEFCHRMGYQLILLTNSVSCPAASYADILLLVPEAKKQYTVTPYIAVLEALAREIGIRLAPDSISNLDELDAILFEQDMTNWKAGSGTETKAE